MRPISNFASKTSTSTKNESSRLVPSQTWTRSGSCPKGTIPIRIIQRKDLLRADSLEHFGRDGPRTSSIANTTIVQRKLLVNPPLATHSVAYIYTKNGQYMSVKGDINVWSPHVEPEEYTTGQIWLKTDIDNEAFGSIEAGWVVYPKLYGDAQPRLFARWTLDGYNMTGCFGLTCAGFVQTSKKVALGGAIQPVSKKDVNVQQFIRIQIFFDSTNWWLSLGDEKIGYWPGTLFKQEDVIDMDLNYSLFGGDVYSQNVKTTTPHTTTAMGSGEFAAGLYANACFVRNIMFHLYHADDGLWQEADASFFTHSDEPNCYTAYNGLSMKPPTFYFGGPGRNAKCP